MFRMVSPCQDHSIKGEGSALKLQDNVTFDPGVVLTIGGILVGSDTGPQAKSDTSRLLHGRCRNFLGSVNSRN